MTLEQKLEELERNVIYRVPLISNQEPQDIVVETLKNLRLSETSVNKIDIVKDVGAAGSSNYVAFTSYLGYMKDTGLIDIGKRGQNYSISLTEKGKIVPLEAIEFIDLGRQDGQRTRIMKECRIVYVINQHEGGALFSRLPRETGLVYADVRTILHEMIKEDYVVKGNKKSEGKSIEVYKLTEKGNERFKPYLA
jgi:predicted transcriptional regulator